MFERLVCYAALLFLTSCEAYESTRTINARQCMRPTQCVISWYEATPSPACVDDFFDKLDRQ
jgi:hypothetical protein